MFSVARVCQSEPRLMSHLSILPTVLRDSELLISSLRSMGFEPQLGGWVKGFAAERQRCTVQVTLSDGQTLAWQRQDDGRLALVADLQRLSRHQSVPALLTRLTRLYALQDALRAGQGSPELASAEVTLVP